jgi:hypothetical protein
MPIVHIPWDGVVSENYAEEEYKRKSDVAQEGKPARTPG